MKQNKGYDNDHPVGVFFACMNVSGASAGDLPSVEKSFFRNLVAAVFAAVILCKNRTVPKVDKKYWGPLILRCVCGTLGILCNFYAIDHLLVADASILNKLSPFFAIIFSFLLLKEKIRPAQAACVALAFIGCLFVVKPGFQNAALVPALIGVCGGLGAGIAYTMVRVLGTHGVKDQLICFIFHFLLLVGCTLDVVPFHTHEYEAQSCDIADGRIIRSGRTVLRLRLHTPMHLQGRFPSLITRRLFLLRCWDLSCLERFRISTALQDMC